MNAIPLLPYLNTTPPQNAGVIVANLPVMRRHYAAFIAMMLDPRASEGLYYHGYGPADQGIINKVRRWGVVSTNENKRSTGRGVSAEQGGGDGGSAGGLEGRGKCGVRGGEPGCKHQPKLNGHAERCK